jgi:hypothetical protein
MASSYVEGDQAITFNAVEEDPLNWGHVQGGGGMRPFCTAAPSVLEEGFS